MKKCQNCQLDKLESEFSTSKSRGKVYVLNDCLLCFKEKRKQYRKNNKDKIKKRDKDFYEKVKGNLDFIKKNKKYRELNKENKREYDKIYRENHKNQYKQYCLDNKESIANIRHEYYLIHKNEKSIYNAIYYQIYYEKFKDYIKIRNSKYLKSRIKNDITFKIKSYTSRTINKYLRLNFSSKNGNSILKFLSYSIQELKIHLEKQFEPWMTWNNWGMYIKDEWSDNDQSTWKWNIDHIIPQSKLLYTSMEDENFNKCWALENLRPLSAKQNILEGNRDAHSHHV